MSKQLINEYRSDLDRLRAVSGSRRESVLREAFKDLLKSWGRTQNLHFVAEQEILTRQMRRIYVDGALLHGLRVPFGYWEAKDENDDLIAEIEAKFRKGYPKTNIVFTDDVTAVLWQNGVEVMRAAMQADDESLLQLLTRFFAHERREIADFNKAVRQFAIDLPNILTALRELIAKKHSDRRDFATALSAFLKHAREAINPIVSDEDVREMLIQHILTEDIFAKVFNDPDFHRKNNVAAELYKLEDRLFARGEKATLLRALDPYYSGIASTAALIQSHSEKQGFLKALYEDFYKAYNKKAADRLGVVYTPSEIVRFIIRSADWLCEKHFDRSLSDRNVEILDPATGTGTFIVELIEHFRGNREKLRHKYAEELHANEVAILPYYVANLNIEATYQAITGSFVEFENLCFVDTLDNVSGLGIRAGHQFDLLGSLSDENIERIKRQNRRKISVVIGNPPYNANQRSENENNKNRAYRHIDLRIKDTYIKASKARKTKLYDPYVRFFRWATDRLGNNGMLAFITNRSFIDALGFDGFRKSVGKDFFEGWILDLGGDFKRKDDAGGGNVFGIGTGVAISFWIKREGADRDRRLLYRSIPRMDAEDKLAALSRIELTDHWDALPMGRADWIGLPTHDASGMLPLVDSKTKVANRDSKDRAIFRLYSLGVSTNRDDWLYGRERADLLAKVRYFNDVYKRLPPDTKIFPNEIKWSRNLKRRLAQGRREDIKQSMIVDAEYRPFSRRFLYRSPLFVDELGQALASFPAGEPNTAIGIARGRRGTFACLAFARTPALDWFIPDACQYQPRYRYSKSGEKLDNITDWAQNKFSEQYGKKGITKEAIFHYVYAVLHDPIYREKYSLNLKREFPHIPFYKDFPLWAAWGKTLMSMHVDYEKVDPWPIKVVKKSGPKGTRDRDLKPILKSDPERRLVQVDEQTQLAEIPRDAWNYKLGNRTAIDWILDQHKEKSPRDPTVRERFDDYSFADHKGAMIELLAKIVRISIETVAITDTMRDRKV